MTDDTTIIKTEATPMGMIEQAISLGRSPEELGKLLDLQERWEANRAKQEYFKAMNECQAELPRVVKDRENTHTRSSYATLEAVNIAVMPVFTQHGFAISFNEEESPVSDAIKLTATVRHSGGHSEQFSAVVPLDGSGIKGNTNKTATQSKGSTLTYARRYLMLMIGNIAVCDEDTDGNASDATLNEEQVLFLANLITQCEYAGDPVNMKRFFATCRISTDDAELGDIKQVYYDAAKRGLSDKLDRAKKAAVEA